jgi:hypothetical protein
VHDVNGEAPWRAKAQAVIAIAIGGAGLLAGLILGYMTYHVTTELNSYRAAAPCAAASDATSGSSCRYTGDAMVTANSRQTMLSVQLAFSAIRGRAFTAAFATNNEPASGSVATGSVVTAELWAGRVTRAGGVGTVDDPENQPPAQDLLIGAIVFAFFGILGIVWGIQFARNAWRTS